MKKILYLAVSLSAILLMTLWISPSHLQEATSDYRLIVSFISFANGIDYESKNKIVEFISDYEEKKGVNIAKEVIHWGREGEVDYCFKLTEISQSEQKKFISKIKLLSLESQRIQLRENSPCQQV